MLKVFGSWFLARASEPSTWSGLVISGAGLVHVAASGDLVSAASGVGVALAGLASVVLRERGVI